MSATVEITEDDGTYTAIDTETGAAGSGRTKAMALVALAAALGGGVSLPADGETDPEEALRTLSERAQTRFAEAGVTEDDVEDAIRWARSE